MQHVMQHLAKAGSIEGIESKPMMFAERQSLFDAEQYELLERRYA